MTNPSPLPSVKQFILDHFLEGEDPSRLTATTPLMTGGIIDSLGLLEVVSFLEKEFHLEFEAHEVAPANFDTLAGIETLVKRKQSQRGSAS